VTVGAGGQIIIVYAGSQANAKLSPAATNKLDISPWLSANNDIVWICGTASRVTNPALATLPVADASTVPAAYLPTSCHA